MRLVWVPVPAPKGPEEVRRVLAEVSPFLCRAVHAQHWALRWVSVYISLGEESFPWRCCRATSLGKYWTITSISGCLHVAEPLLSVTGTETFPCTCCCTNRALKTSVLHFWAFCTCRSFWTVCYSTWIDRKDIIRAGLCSQWYKNLIPALTPNSHNLQLHFFLLSGQINPLAAQTLLWVRGIWLMWIEPTSILVLINLASTQILLRNERY